MRWFRQEKSRRSALSAVSGAPAIDMRNVVYKRAGKVILDGLSLQLDERRVGIIGDNGSGKSTFARLLNGLLSPDSGTLKVFGIDATQHTASLPQFVGFLFQNPDHQILFPTVLEELAFGLTQLGLKQGDAERLAREYLRAQCRIEWADRPSQSLSEGEKQRLCLWSVLLMKPRLLVLDESFASLDLRSRYDFMAELNRQQQQLLMITHELDLLENFERIVWLHKGSVKADGDAKTVISAYKQYARNGL